MTPELSSQWYRYLFEKMPFEQALVLFQASQAANIDNDVLNYLSAVGSMPHHVGSNPEKIIRVLAPRRFHGG